MRNDLNSFDCLIPHDLGLVLLHIPLWVHHLEFPRFLFGGISNSQIRNAV